MISVDDNDNRAVNNRAVDFDHNLNSGWIPAAFLAMPWVLFGSDDRVSTWNELFYHFAYAATLNPLQFAPTHSNRGSETSSLTARELIELLFDDREIIAGNQSIPQYDILKTVVVICEELRRRIELINQHAQMNPETFQDDLNAFLDEVDAMKKGDEVILVDTGYYPVHSTNLDTQNRNASSQSSPIAISIRLRSSVILHRRQNVDASDIADEEDMLHVSITATPLIYIQRTKYRNTEKIVLSWQGVQWLIHDASDLFEYRKNEEEYSRRKLFLQFSLGANHGLAQDQHLISDSLRVAEEILTMISSKEEEQYKELMDRLFSGEMEDIVRQLGASHRKSYAENINIIQNKLVVAQSFSNLHRDWVTMLKELSTVLDDARPRKRRSEHSWTVTTEDDLSTMMNTMLNHCITAFNQQSQWFPLAKNAPEEPLIRFHRWDAQKVSPWRPVTFRSKETIRWLLYQLVENSAKYAASSRPLEVAVEQLDAGFLPLDFSQRPINWLRIRLGNELKVEPFQSFATGFGSPHRCSECGCEAGLGSIQLRNQAKMLTFCNDCFLAKKRRDFESIFVHFSPSAQGSGKGAPMYKDIVTTYFGGKPLQINDMFSDWNRSEGSPDDRKWIWFGFLVPIFDGVIQEDKQPPLFFPI